MVFLEILSKTELSSDIVDNFQDEVFGHLLPYGAVFDTPSNLCYKSQLSRGTRGQKTSNLQKSRTNPLDTFDNVIYVTRVITERTTVFVSASACNPSFGQGYAHFLKGEKAMTNQNATTIASNLVADESGNTNCTNCVNCVNCVNCKNCRDCKNCVDCDNCKDCKNCDYCDNCNKCNNCYYCANCNNCDNCTDCYSCDYCANCNNCSGCTECESCKDCGDRVNNVSAAPIERHRDDEDEECAE